MVYKLVSIYGGIEEPDQFLEYYRESIVPKLLSFDGVIKICVTRMTQRYWKSEGSEHLKDAQILSELYVLDVEQFMDSISFSEEGKEITHYLSTEANNIANIYVGAEETIYKDLFFQG